MAEGELECIATTDQGTAVERNMTYSTNKTATAAIQTIKLRRRNF
jgi:hypothetical protein